MTRTMTRNPRQAATGILAVLAASLAALLLLMSLPAASQDYRARDGGPSHAEMIARSGGAAKGLAFVRPVLSGVLYRGGFKGGDKARTGLSSSQLSELCDNGFSRAFYVDYGKNTKFGKTPCKSGLIDYQSTRSSRASNVMKALYEVIQNPDQGPVYVHCMWGVHSSGAVAAMALVQFCGWSENRAKEYWNDARNGAPCSGGCDKWIDGKFAKFSVDASLNISNAQRAAICPK